MRLKLLVSVAATAVLAAAATIPRTPDGHPDLQGTYDLATLTPMERTAGSKTGADSTRRRRSWRGSGPRSRISPSGRSRPIGKRPRKAVTDRRARPENVGGYNTFWLDPGSSYTIVDGQKRASLVVDPPDGRVPPYIPAAQKRVLSLLARPTSDAQESRDPGLEAARIV